VILDGWHGENKSKDINYAKLSIVFSGYESSPCRSHGNAAALTAMV
jgi:hypothetical protein